MKVIYSILNNFIPGLLFPIATIICINDYYIIGTIIYAFAYIGLDLHSYIDKKLDYPNNIFINH